MPSRLFISIFNGLLLMLGLGLLCAPFVGSERFLLPLYSSQYLQMEAVRLAQASSEGKRILLLGDSTIRNLHTRKEDIVGDMEFANLGAGGAMSQEWLYTMRNALRVGKSFRAVVVGMTNGESFDASNGIPPYFPFLLETADALKEWRAGHLDAEQALQLFTYIHLKTVYVKNDMLYMITAEFLPPMRDFMMGLVLNQAERAVWRNVKPGVDFPGRATAGVRELLRLAGARDLPVVFLLSPISSTGRKDQFYSRRRAAFHQTCELLKLICEDFSQSVPDAAFEDDGVHLKAKHAVDYKTLIVKALKKRGLG